MYCRQYSLTGFLIQAASLCEYEVMLGDTARMEYKIACMNDAILELSEYQSGILDISFTYKTDQVVYTPFG